jgi:hypothetical protein
MEKSSLLHWRYLDCYLKGAVCQVSPGILIGEKSLLLYGSVEASVPLKWNRFHKLLSEKISGMMVAASRPVEEPSDRSEIGRNQ